MSVLRQTCSKANRKPFSPLKTNEHDGDDVGDGRVMMTVIIKVMMKDVDEDRINYHLLRQTFSRKK